MVSWLFVIADRAALHWVLSQQRMAFRSHVHTHGLTVGDDVVVYATRGCWHNPTRDRAQVAAIGKIASSVKERPIDVAGEGLARHCRLRLEIVLPEREGFPFSDLVDRLRLTRGRSHWGPLLRRTIVALDPGDFALIRDAIMAANLA